MDDKTDSTPDDLLGHIDTHSQATKQESESARETDWM